MLTPEDRRFGALITHLIAGRDLDRRQTREAFSGILQNTVTEMQQGAFLAALAAKGETRAEVAGAWEAIYALDTCKVRVPAGQPLVENSGTGMDTFKTFNISTAAAVVAAAGGIRMARHGARAITSVCGTVDMAEALGVDVECSAAQVAGSIEKAGIGLFNGMSPRIHPRALGRILSQIGFGSTLNIAASLANPALPSLGVRGVYSADMIRPVVEAMQAIGYRRALVCYGRIGRSGQGMDEASVCGTTDCAELLPDGGIRQFRLRPQDAGLAAHRPDDLVPAASIDVEARRLVALISGHENGVRRDAVLLNAGLIFYVAGAAPDISGGVRQAAAAIDSGGAREVLANWVQYQNTDPAVGLAKLAPLMRP